LAASRSIFFDSNALIFAFEGQTPWSDSLSALIGKIESGAVRGVLSELSLGEILVKPLALQSQRHIDIYMRLFDPSGPFEVFPVNRDIILASAQLQAFSGLKLADALLVATSASARCSQFLTADERLGRRLGADPVWLHPDHLSGWIDT